MKIPFVDLHAQYQSIKGDIDSAIAAVIRESAFVRSHFVDEFEAQWSQTLGVKHCVSCGNGTDALYIVLRGLGIKPGDEVITTAHSWIATSEVISQAGGKVVFCDTDRETFTIDPVQLAAKITPRTVGIIPVHLFGQPADMDAILSIARKHGIWVIEDCAQAHLARFKGRLVGTFGTAAIFSFYPGKNLGAMGDAGCLVTDDDRLAEWCALFARHGGKGDHVMEGINSRLDGLQAAILSAKLPHLVRWTERRQTVAAIYTRELSGLVGLRCPVIAKHRTHVFHLYVLRYGRRDELRAHMEAKGIATVLNYPRALPFYRAYAHLNHTAADFPEAYSNQTHILSIPIFPEISDAQIEYVVSVIRQLLETHAGDLKKDGRSKAGAAEGQEEGDGEK